jgi:pimeloyl-ACP methyl ester carboxylesterase
MALHGSRETPEGWRLSYDPSILVAFAQAAGSDLDLWDIWDRINCPTFVLHGADSPLLTDAILGEMKGRGPRPETATLAGVGHAPALNTGEQIAIIARWLGLGD